MVRQAMQLAALPWFSDTLTLSQPGSADYAKPLALPQKIPWLRPENNELCFGFHNRIPILKMLPNKKNCFLKS